MIEPPLRTSAIFPNCESLIHLSKLLSSVRPRVRVHSPAFHRPGCLLTMYLPSAVFCLSSMTSCSIFSPLTSVMDLMVMPSNCRPNEWPTLLLSGGSGMGLTLLLRSESLADQGGAAGELGEPEDDELGRLDRGDADLAQHLTGVDGVGRVRLLVALDVEGVVRRVPEQGAPAPLPHQEGTDRTADARPQRAVVGLEDAPLRPVEDGFLEI